jgi:predicted 3-demethylubiquinone-9 3-methyltransferase (glyoxalase superfamily)
MLKITPFLWFDTEAEEAARFYCSIFPNSKIGQVSRYGPGAPGPEGSVMTVSFELDGLPVTALNGGPAFQFSEAVSFSISCDGQAEVDRYWAALTDGGEEGPCAWCKDRFGFSWQVVPKALPELLSQPDRAKAARVMQAMMGMKKIDIAVLRAASTAA